MSAPDGPVGAQGRPAAKSRLRDLRMVGLGIVIALLAWFAFDNTQSVEIHFWLSTRQAPLVVVIILAAVLGALLGALGAWLFARSRRGRRGSH